MMLNDLGITRCCLGSIICWNFLFRQSGAERDNIKPIVSAELFQDQCLVRPCLTSLWREKKNLLTGLQLGWGHSEEHHLLLLFSNLLQHQQAPTNALYSRPEWVKKKIRFFFSLPKTELQSQMYRISTYSSQDWKPCKNEVDVLFFSADVSNSIHM